MNFDKKTIVPCVDWFRGILPVTDIKKFLDELGKLDSRLVYENWIKTDMTMLNFSQRWCHRDMKSLTFAFNPNPDNPLLACEPGQHNNAFVLFSLSGDAIRFLGSESLKNLFQYFYSLEYLSYRTRCTRLDLALDFFEKDNNIVPLMIDCLGHFLRPVKHEPCVISSFKRDPKNWQLFTNVYPDTGEVTLGFNLGNHGSSHGMFRLYDKKFECLYGRNRTIGKELVKDRDYWYRAELELHNCTKKEQKQWANEAFFNLVESDFNIYGLYGHCINDFFRLVDNAICVDSCVSNSDSSALWTDFVSFLENNIHFVQLVSEKFIDLSEEKMWRELERTSALLYVREQLKKSNPTRYYEIFIRGRDKLQQDEYRLKYGAVLENLPRFAFTPVNLQLDV